MNNQELFALRKNQGRDFASPNELRIFLETMFGKDFVFPMVVGPDDFPENNWKVVQLEPLKTSDRLTIEGYLEALKEIQKGHGHPRRYTGKLYLGGVDSMNYKNWDTNIAIVSIRQEKEDRTIETLSFDLNLHFSAMEEQGRNGKKVGYHAFSELDQTELQKICAKFQGPNRDYRRVLI